MKNKLNLHQRTINALIKIITGESFYNEEADPSNFPFPDPDPFYLEAMYKSEQLSPAMSQKEQLDLFVDLGLDNSSMLDRNSPFRTMDEPFYIEKCLRKIYSVDVFSELISRIFHPIRFVDTHFGAEFGVAKLNEYLILENLEIYSQNVFQRKTYRLRELNSSQVKATLLENSIQHLSHEYIFQQIEKCDSKLQQQDYTGAITNARTLIEEVSKAIVYRLNPEPKDFSGDLLKLYKEVQRLLNLDPSQYDVTALKQLLAGLVSIINAVSSLRNSSSDSHAIRFQPSKHHAQLVVDAATTIANFLFNTFEYQLSKGLVKNISHIKAPLKEVNKF
jgi:hypothetical protein